MVRDSRSHGDHPEASPPAVDPALHERVVGGDPVAIEQVWLTFHGQLVRLAMSKLFRSADQEDIANDLVVNLLESYLAHPAKYQRERGKTLGGYLRMALEGDLKNHFAKVARAPRIVSMAAARDDTNDDVGDDDRLGNMPSAASGPEEDVLAHESDARVQRWRGECVHTPEEDTVFQLQYIDNERATEVFAAALGWHELSPGEQVRQVQKIKDRLAKRLARMQTRIDER